MKTMVYDPVDLQKRLAHLGFYSGPIDGIVGPQTDAAIVAFKESIGFKSRPYVGPLTLKALYQATKTAERPAKPGTNVPYPPWLNELAKVYGLHEDRDNKALSAWLKSDGSTVGNPASIAWCGDAMETAIRRALPNEPMEPLKGNPYWARNWQHFGIPCGRVLGAMVPMTRGKGGHIATLIGVSKDGRKIRCRGGNQSDTINDAWFDAKHVTQGGRIIDYRWPRTWSPHHQVPAPVMDSKGAILSTNEA